jgi:hypothetical protein
LNLERNFDLWGERREVKGWPLRRKGRSGYFQLKKFDVWGVERWDEL